VWEWGGGWRGGGWGFGGDFRRIFSRLRSTSDSSKILDVEVAARRGASNSNARAAHFDRRPGGEHSRRGGAALAGGRASPPRPRRRLARSVRSRAPGGASPFMRRSLKDEDPMVKKSRGNVCAPRRRGGPIDISNVISREH